MKPVAFDYVRPASVAEACRLLAADDGARVIAGGQTLIPMLAMRLARPTWLVDIARIPDLCVHPRGRRWRDHRRGDATVRRRARSASSRRRLPLLAKALPWVGHPPTRHRGTIGGSIANGDPAAEIALVAVTLGATHRGAGRLAATSEIAGRRILSGSDDHGAAGGRHRHRASASRSGREGRIGTGFHEVSARRSDFALVAAAAQVALDADGRCTALAVGIGGAGDSRCASMRSAKRWSDRASRTVRCARRSRPPPRGPRDRRRPARSAPPIAGALRPPWRAGPSSRLATRQPEVGMRVELQVNGSTARGRCRAAPHAARLPARQRGPQGHACRLRARRVRGLHHPASTASRRDPA